MKSAEGYTCDQRRVTFDLLPFCPLAVPQPFVDLLPSQAHLLAQRHNRLLLPRRVAIGEVRLEEFSLVRSFGEVCLSH